MMEKTEQGLGRLCVIGDPVEHSKSPLIQNAMIAKLGIPYHYTKRLVHQGDTQEWLDTARREGFAGFNATMPHKVALVPLMDELGEDARLYGAVNTVCIRGKRCIGHNTDGMGFYQALTDLGVEVPGRRITLLGAGGAAKAVALKLVQQGAGPITVCNRTPQKAEALCNLAKGRMGHIGFALEDLRRGARDCDILINCTSQRQGDGTARDRGLRPGRRGIKTVPAEKNPLFRGDRSLWGVGPSSQLREHRQNKTRKS